MQLAPSDHDLLPGMGLETAIALLEQLPTAIVLVGPRGDIRYANAPVVHLFGYAQAELAGKPATLLFPTELRGAEAARGSAAPDSPRNLTGLRKDGTRCACCVEYGRVVADEETLAAWVIRLEPDTNLQELTLTRSRLNESQQIAKLGSWTWDFAHDTHWWSDELYHLLRVESRSTEGPFGRFLALVHPMDRKRLDEMRTQLLSGDPISPTDVRIRFPNGDERIIQTRARITLDQAGQPLSANGTLQDITEQRFTNTALKLTELRYQETQRLARIGNWESDLVTGKSWWSQELYQILEEDPGCYAATFENFLARVHPADRDSLQHRSKRIAIGADAYKPSETRLLMRSGREKIVQHSVEVRVDDDGQPTAVVGTILDVTERRALETLLRESESRYSGTVELAAVGIAHVDPDGRLIWTNTCLQEILGYTKQELEHCTVWDISHPDDRHVTDEERVQMHAGALDSLRVEKRYVRKDGATIWVKISCAPRRDETGKFLYDISIVEDITPRKAAEARIHFLATHDELTGLPNRALFSETLSRTIGTARLHDRGCALLFVDLDRFKIVNDSLGHDAGDQLLKEVAQRIIRCVRSSDVVARFGGDEFIVLLDQVTDKVAAATANKILSAMLDPVRIMSYECRVTASIGISRFPKDGQDAATLMKCADMGMYRAKEEGKNNVQFYSAATSPMSVERIVLETHLVRALERNELWLQYQPKIEISSGRICGVEALLRWRNPQLGLVSPNAFIPLAEDTGLIVAIGEWVLREACAQCMAWQRLGLPALVMAVNLSPRQFKDPGLAEKVTRALGESGLRAQLLELEITESMIMNSVDQAAKTAELIKALGVRLAIDDFGTGYSSLSQLKRFPIDTLKIDRSFIRELPHNAEDMAITEAIISLGKALKVNVVAEGVETRAQEAFLRERACNEIQGFLYSEPCDPDAFVQLFKAITAAAPPQAG